VAGNPDEARFGELIAAYGPALKRLARAYCANPFDQQDLFQEIAMAVWSGLERFRGEASVRTWIYRIAHNVALSFRSKQRRVEAREQPIEEHPTGAGADHDQRRELLEMVRRLPPVDRQVVLLHLEGLTGAEIAEVTGLTASNVGVRLMRARQKMISEVQAKETKS